MVSILPADEAARTYLYGQLPADSQLDFCLVADEEGERLGYIVCRFEENAVCLLTVEAGDRFLVDGLIRAALNRALGQGLEFAVCRNPAMFPVLERLGFVPDAGGAGRRAVIRQALRGSCHGGRHG